MKIITRTFIAFIALLILPLALFAQAKSITSENYYAVLREAESKTDEQISKSVQIQKLYTNGKVTRTLTGTSEKLPPDKSRWVHIDEKEGKVIKRVEQITIGNIIYRKENNGGWVKSEEGTVLSGPGGAYNSSIEFFIEEIKIGKEKFQVLTRKTVSLDKTRFEEDKIWINEKGLISKSTSTTSQNELKNIVSTVDVTYDYKIKPPKIEAPIK